MRYVVIPLFIILYSWWTYKAIRYKVLGWQIDGDAWVSWKVTHLLFGTITFLILSHIYW